MILSLREEREGSAEVSEENKAMSRRFYEELFNRGNLDAAEELARRGAPVAVGEAG